MPALLPIAGLLEVVTDVGAAAESGIIAGFSAVGLGSVGVGVAGAVGSGILAIGGASGLGAAIGAWAVAGTVLELAFYKPKLNSNGSPQQFKADTNAPIPVVEGHFGVGGNIVYLTTSGGSNKAAAGAAGNEYLTACVVLSGLGPIQGFDTLKFNDTILNWSGQECTGGYILADTIGAYNVPYHNNENGTYENDQYNNHAWQNFQNGNVPTPYFAPPTKLASDNAALPEWDTTHGLSGFAASFLTIVYDQTVYAGGQPKPLWTINGISKYDPRQDSTYPGGSGLQRWAGQGATAEYLYAVRATYQYNTNPIISALNFALGYWLPDANGVAQLYAGAGVPWVGVDVDAFVAAANVADANGWTLNGQWTTNDDPYSVLTAMLQCGGASPTDKDGRVSCIINTPLTSLGTITNNDLTGPIAVDTQAAIKNRINRVWPRFRSEPHNFDMVPVTIPIVGNTYVAEDQNRYRDKQLDYEFVTSVNQCCQLAAYDIVNSREGIVAVIPGKQTLANYRVGDAVTVTIDEANLTDQKMLVIKRSPDFNTGGVTLTLRSETDAKHAFALGQSGVAPPSPTISGVDPSYVSAPIPTAWSTGALTLLDPDTGQSTTVIQITGAATDNVYAQVLLVRYRLVTDVDGTWTPVGSGAWTYTSFASSQGQFNLDLNPGYYDVQIAYQLIGGAVPTTDAAWTDLGVETVNGSVSANTANVGTATAGQIETLPEQIAAIQSEIASVSAAASSAEESAAATAQDLEDGAEAALSNAVQGFKQLLASHAATFTPTGLPIGPFSVDQQKSIDGVVSTQAVMGTLTPDGSGFVLSQTAVYSSPGVLLSEQITELAAATAAVSATLTTSYLTAAETNEAIAGVQTTLQANINAVSATLTSTYLTTSETNGAISTAVSAAELTLNTSINSVSANLSNNYQTTSEVNGAISTAVASAQTTLQANINAVSSNLAVNYFTASEVNGAISTAIAQAELTLNASINSVSASLSVNYLTAAETNSAIASAQTTLQANINGVSATVSEQAAAIVNLQGITASYLSFTAASGDSLASIQIVAANGYTGTVQLTGNVVIDGNLLVDGSVGTAQIASGAITNTTMSENTTTMSLGAVNSAAVEIGALTVTVSGASLLIDVNIQINNTDTSHDASAIAITLRRDGNQISDPFYCFVRANTSSLANGQPDSRFARFVDAGLAAGSHTWTVYAQWVGGAGSSGSVSCRLCRIIIQDLNTEA